MLGLGGPYPLPHSVGTTPFVWEPDLGNVWVGNAACSPSILLYFPLFPANLPTRNTSTQKRLPKPRISFRYPHIGADTRLGSN